MSCATACPAARPEKSTGPAVVRAMSTEIWLGYLGISMDPKKAEGMRFTINLVTPYNGEKYLVELSNATLIHTKGQRAKNADLTIALNRAELNMVMLRETTFDDLAKAGKSKFDGDRKPFDQLRGLMVAFTPNFEILPGTAPKSPSQALAPFVLPDMLDGD
jgi:alkyl sulfatase BDS1-like metallo-beta-lactamase superfamily hydrolase